MPKLPRGRLPNHDGTNQKLGARLRALRKQVGFTRQQLADALSVSLTQLRKYERGLDAIPATRIIAACEALGVDANELFSSVLNLPT